MTYKIEVEMTPEQIQNLPMLPPAVIPFGGRGYHVTNPRAVEVKGTVVVIEYELTPAGAL